jgi:glycosyltransferase involved in cell wall biosynthesis
MNIAIDASRANKIEKTGVEWYSYFVIEELKKLVSDGDRVVLYSGDKLRDGLEKLPENWQEKKLNWPPKYLWTQIRLWWELMINPPDVLLVTAHTIPFLPIRRKTKVAITVHDVGFKRFPKLYKKIQYWYHNLTMYKIRSRADIIFTVSEFSKSEIVELYNVSPDKIKVALNGFSQDGYQIDGPKPEALSKYKIKKPYLLYVGRIEKKKNVINMIKAFIKLSESNADLNLVLAGGAGNSIDEVKAIILDNKLEDRIILPGYIDEEDLPYLFKSAEVFLFPTLYEGFGIPILQAMAVGTPVVTSNQNPHQEVGGEFAVYVDPKDVDGIVDGILKVLGDDNLKESLILGGLEQVKKFSWANTAEEIFKSL